MVIEFYKTSDKYGCFSNFSSHPIRIKNKTWPTSEHYFQGQKFAGTDYEEDIRKTKKPHLAARMGRSRKQNLREDWQKIKDSIMYDAVLAKFEQHKDIQEILLSTGDEKIVEHTEKDSYWGDGGDGSGKNMLGIILMKVRQTIRDNKSG